MLAYVTNDRLAAGVDHVVYGGVFAVFLQLLLIMIGLRWREKDTSVHSNYSGVATMRRTTESLSGVPGRKAYILATAVSILVVATTLLASYLWNKAASATAWADQSVTVTAPWQVTANDDFSWFPNRRGADKEFLQNYRSGVQQAALSWAVYSGRQEAELANAEDGLANAKGWSITANGHADATVGGQRIRAQQSLAQSGTISRSIWSWYCVGGEYTGSLARVKFLQAKARVFGKPATVAVVSVGTDRNRDDLETERALQDFLRHVSFPSSSWSKDSFTKTQPSQANDAGAQ